MTASDALAGYDSRPLAGSAGMTRTYWRAPRRGMSLLRRRGGIERGVGRRRLVEALDRGATCASFRPSPPARDGRRNFRSAA